MADWPELVAMLVAGRNAAFAGNVDGPPSYVCEGWDRRRLLSVWALPVFNPLRDGRAIGYDAFFAAQPPLDANGHPQTSDPRAAVALIAIPDVYSQDEPVIVIDRGGPMLLEGYLRSLLFMHSCALSAELLVWVPQAVNNSP